MSNSDLIISQIRQRLEILYQMVDELEAGGGGGGGGTTDYNDLTNKPSINNQVLTGNKSLSELGAATPSDITQAFAPSTIELAEGGTFPSDSRNLLTEHKPLNVNNDQYYFLEETGVDYLYGSMPTSGAYPSLSYLRIMKSSFTVEFHNTEIDTVPTKDSDNLITSGAVYDAIPNITVDQIYDATSTNAQSGVAVKEAIDSRLYTVSLGTPVATCMSSQSFTNPSGNQSYIYALAFHIVRTAPDGMPDGKYIAISKDYGVIGFTIQNNQLIAHCIITGYGVINMTPGNTISITTGFYNIPAYKID